MGCSVFKRCNRGGAVCVRAQVGCNRGVWVRVRASKLAQAQVGTTECARARACGCVCVRGRGASRIDKWAETL